MNQSSKNLLSVTIFRLLAGLIGLFFLVLGLGFMAFPDMSATAFSVQPVTIQGLNAVRGDFGGLFLGLSFFCFLGAATKRWPWLMVPIVFLLLIIVGRLISLSQDGFFAGGARTVILEIILLALLITSALVFFRKAVVNINSLESSKFLNRRILFATVVVAAILTVLLFSQRRIGMGMINGLATKAMNTDVLSGLPDGLHLALCGSGSPLADARRASACTAVIAGQSLYLIDIGPASERKLELMKLNPGKVRAVLLTHFHSDHIGDLGELMLKRWSGGSRKTPLPVFGPIGVETVVQGFNQAYALDTEYRILHHGPETVPPSGAGGVARSFSFPQDRDETLIIDEDELKVTAFLVDHTPVKPAVGYRFDYKGRSVVISGDTVPTPSLIKQARGVDLLVQEALQPAMVRILKEVGQKIGRTNTAKIMGDILSYHTSPEDAAKIAAKAGVGHLLLTHIVPPLPASDLKAAFLGDSQKFYRNPITIGEDGMLFSLPAGSRKIQMEWLL